jgi:glyoxylase-like metal-dependent hydrolase (beta-lactamase superfamily II)
MVQQQSSPAFASTGDQAEKTITFGRLGEGLYAYTAQGDPNTGIIVGDEAAMVIDTQATPLMAKDVIARVRTVTDKPIKYVLLTHYHAVRVLGASAYGASEILASEATRKMIVERGEQDKASEIGRFPRLFRGADSVPPGLTWPTTTFTDRMTLWLGKRRVEIVHLGRGHTAGDTIAWVPDSGVMFSGDLVEYKSACYCGDAHFADWPKTLDRLAAYGAKALVPGRGDALVGPDKVRAAIDGTRGFLNATFETAQEAVAQGKTLKETFKAVRQVMDKPFGDYAIYEHCLPFNVSRAYDEARGIDHPVVWTDVRDREMWAALQG